MHETSFGFELDEESRKTLDEFFTKIMQEMKEKLEKCMRELIRIFDSCKDSWTIDQHVNLGIDAGKDKMSTWRYKQNGILYAAELSMHPE